MFDLYLQYIQWKQSVKSYLLGKLSKPKSIHNQVIRDIDIAFLSGQSMYRIYLFDSLTGELSLLDYVESFDHQSIEAELDLHYLYFELVDKVKNHYMWFSDINVISHNKGNNKYLEIYRKNYKQIIDKEFK